MSTFLTCLTTPGSAKARTIIILASIFVFYAGFVLASDAEGTIGLRDYQKTVAQEAGLPIAIQNGSLWNEPVWEVNDTVAKKNVKIRADQVIESKSYGPPINNFTSGWTQVSKYFDASGNTIPSLWRQITITAENEGFISYQVRYYNKNTYDHPIYVTNLY